MSNEVTTIRTVAGTDIEVENQNGGRIRVLVVRNDTGEAGSRHIPVGSRVGDVVGNANGEVRRNGSPADDEDILEDGDRLSVTPENPEGN